MTPFTLFEVSWEVCNKVGGIHTVLSSKAKTAVAVYGDEYVAVGPWLLSEEATKIPFDDDPAYAEFADSCRQMGIPVRVGRWRISSRPRCILIEFSSLYGQKDDILAKLWEDHAVDSISGAWDYVEPVLFGYAAGRVIEEWWERYLAPFHHRAIVHAHEWMTASSLLYVKKSTPAIGTVFTTHATMLGRALSSLGHSPEDGLGDQTAEGLAKIHGVEAKHSIEGIAARVSDVFTTVSSITAKEAELLHARPPVPVLPNGIDLDVVDDLIEGTRDEIRAALENLATHFLGVNVHDASMICVSGRYEYHNKGIDVLLDALATCNKAEGRPIVAFVLVPAGNSGIRAEVLERLEAGVDDGVRDPIGITTHNLFDEESDPVVQHCRRVGLQNASGDRVKVIQIPVYFHGDDGLLNRSYETILSAMDLSVFPSFYEPWGYTPQESLAVGVPTITSDYAGFGRWAESEALGPDAGVTVLHRVGKDYESVVRTLAEVIELRVVDAERGGWFDICRATAQKTAWSDLFANYQEAYTAAVGAIQGRLIAGAPLTRRPRADDLSVDTKSAHSPRLRRFDVAIQMPEALRPLERISRNLAWCWDVDAAQLFADMSPTTWHATGHNPVEFLRQIAPADLAARAADAKFAARVQRVATRFDAYLAARCESYSLDDGDAALSSEHPIAYFCAEFGIHESLPIYSGGLGILAGDHLKSASDLNIPLIGVGLFYRMGYMAQQLTSDGQQVAVDRENDPGRLPVELVRDRDGSPLEVVISLPSRALYLRAWRVHVGRVKLFLLDANTPSNREEDREITRHLYGGDHEMRIRQLIALGRGGVRLLDRLGIQPSVFHMNEGHAAFLSLERVARLVRENRLTFEAARERVRNTTAFTTHTPVPAGHDRFAEDLVRRYFSDVAEWVGVPWERFIDFGRASKSDTDFNMTYLALTFSAHCNGVSKLHGVASRALLHNFWPGLLECEVPVGSVTNGVHLPTWTSPAIQRLLRGATATSFASNAKNLDPTALWSVRCDLKSQLGAKIRERTTAAFLKRNDSPLLLSRTLDGLDENALWVGFARRFAPYKRAHLIFQDLARLQQLCNSTDRPLRLIVAGKAHPRDVAGQDILRDIARATRSDAIVGKVFFVEDYDIELGRSLVQGVDVWLNNPTRMLEASGTSGMKAAANGVLNLSIADGWWPEAADGENGWTIGEDRVYADQLLQDQFDGSALYSLLEHTLLPMFFDRGADGVPREWMRRVIHDLETVPPQFNSDRMVMDYFAAAYRELGRAYFAGRRDGHEDAKRRAEEGRRIRKAFDQIRIVDAGLADVSELAIGDVLDVRMRVDLGSLTVHDVKVELVIGNDAGDGDLKDLVVVALEPRGGLEGTQQAFVGKYEVQRAGRHAHGLRVRARRHSSSPSSLRGLVLWA